MEENRHSSDAPPTQEAIRPGVHAYREAISKADGSLRLLRKTTTDGKVLHIAARHFDAPANEQNTGVNKGFWGWNDKSLPMSGVMLIDVYAGNPETDIQPLGHMDWCLRGERANGSGNMHPAVLPKRGYEQLANEMWDSRTSTGFKIDPKYHRQDIGTLMVATSAVVLPSIGVKSFFTGVLLGPAESTYKRFGLNEEDFFTGGKIGPLPIERLSQHKLVNEVISEFV